MRLALVVGSMAGAAAHAGTTGSLVGFVQGPDGKPLEGVRVIVTGPALPGARVSLTDAHGFYRVTQLPPGREYRARFEAPDAPITERAKIVINASSTFRLPRVSIRPVKLTAKVEVYRKGPMLEQGSTAVGRALGAELFEALPVGRTALELPLLAPGVAAANTGLSFRGAAPSENRVLIDGLDATGVVSGLAVSSLPPAFVQEAQVRTGGYGAALGSAVGGQTLIVTRSGGNEHHGDIFASISPLHARARSVVTGFDDPSTSIEEASWIRQDAERLYGQVGVDLGGPVLKDRLWYFVGYAPSFTRRVIGGELRQLSSVPELERSDPALSEDAVYDSSDTFTHYYLGSLTWRLNQDHRVRVSTFGNPSFSQGRVLEHDYGDPGTWLGSRRSGVQDYSLTYHGRIVDGRIDLDATAGYHTESSYLLPFTGIYHSLTGNSPFEGAQIDGTLPQVLLDRIDAVVPGTEGACIDAAGDPAPCLYPGYRSGGIGRFGWTTARRLVFSPVLSLFLSGPLGYHAMVLGGELERSQVRERLARSGGLEAIGIDDGYLETYDSSAGIPVTWHGVEDDASYLLTGVGMAHDAAFVQDTWNLRSNLALILGLRWERQRLEDISGATRIDLRDSIAPRAGVLFDFTDTGISRAFASYGRYYGSIPLSFYEMALGGRGSETFFFRSDEYPSYAAGAQDVSEDADGDGEPDHRIWSTDGIIPVQEGLSSPWSDQLLIGMEYELMDNVSVGMSGFYSRLGNAVQVLPMGDGGPQVVNPGTDGYYLLAPAPGDAGAAGGQSWTRLDADLDGEADLFQRCFAAVDPLNGAPITRCVPKATRRHRAIELSLNKRLANRSQWLASYTWSQTCGGDSGAAFGTNAYGYLDQDRRHLLKLAGAYTFHFGTTVGLFGRLQSGTPVSWRGRYPLEADGLPGAGEAFVLPRAYVPSDEADDATANGASPVPGRTPRMAQLDLSGHHAFPLGHQRQLQVGVQIDNLLNARRALAVDQGYSADFAAAAVGGQRLSEVQCYDAGTVAAMASCRRGSGFGAPVVYQSPLTVRFDARFSF